MLNASFKSPLGPGGGMCIYPLLLAMVSTSDMNNITLCLCVMGYQSFIWQARELELTKRKHIRQSAFAYSSH